MAVWAEFNSAGPFTLTRRTVNSLTAAPSGGPSSSATRTPASFAVSVRGLTGPTCQPWRLCSSSPRNGLAVGWTPAVIRSATPYTRAVSASGAHAYSSTSLSTAACNELRVNRAPLFPPRCQSRVDLRRPQPYSLTLSTSSPSSPVRARRELDTVWREKVNWGAMWPTGCLSCWWFGSGSVGIARAWWCCSRAHRGGSDVGATGIPRRSKDQAICLPYSENAHDNTYFVMRTFSQESHSFLHRVEPRGQGVRALQP
jgi:hypothetical protein